MDHLGYKLTKAEPVAISAEDIAELRRIFPNTTPGKWKLWANSIMADQDGTSDKATAVEVAHFLSRRTWDADMCAILQRNMPAILALLGTVEFAPPGNYQVQFGPGCQQSETFATFGEALLFYRGYWAANHREDDASEGCRLVNTANIDQAEDAKPWAYAGLTEAEWEAMQEFA